MNDLERDLHVRFVKYGACAKEWLRKCILLLPEIDKLRIWEKKGFASIYEYAAKLAGMSRDKVTEGLRVMRRTECLPELRRVVEEKGIWAVRPVLSIATPENDVVLAEKAREMSKAALEMFVKGACRPGESAEKPLFTMRGLESDNERPTGVKSLWMEVSDHVHERLMRIANGRDWDTLMREFINLHDDEIQRMRPSAVKTDSRHIPEAIKRFVLKRACERCEFLGCVRAYSELHHADRFELCRCHDPDRIFALCKAHHALAHHGLIANEELDVGRWRVRSQADKADMRYKIDQRVQHHKALENP